MIRRQMTARIRFGNIDKGIRNREIDMKNKNKKYSLLYILAGGVIPGAFLGAFLIGMPVSANSSWVWISQTRPYDVLPWVALVTIIIETICLKRVLKEQRWKKVLVVTLVANLLSFAAPYVLYSFDPVFVWSGRNWRDVHLYTVGAIYLLMTIVVEMPVVYGCLKKSAKDRKYLIGVIVGSNVVTTLITAVAERILCWGKW